MLKDYAYAKINLALEVLDEIEDGYHIVNNLMVPIDLKDEITVEKDKEIVIDDDPFKGHNLIEKAAKAFFEYTGIKGGCRFTVKKNIPEAAGLAGGSSDCACAIRLLDKLYNTNLDLFELKKIAESLGSDVPFFIESKLALCKHRGERVFPYNINYKKYRILLIKPSSGLETKEVYKRYKYTSKKREESINSIIDGLENDDVSKIKKFIFNDLGRTAATLNKELKTIFNALRDNDIRVFISGSGPTMYLFDPSDEEIDKVGNILNNVNINNIFILETKIA
ncbi:MAG: 4-(cytidine 5'-diphospho)-2-C-methyl-D-erythritol kinase [Acholeplasmatales bacterium]|nr:4-(cytidine 5'-diphospho)-2-C-methyl-D-erythritol kinase [Acholeplasmatales bacterium]